MIEGKVTRMRMKSPAGLSSRSPPIMKITLTATKPIMASAQYFMIRKEFTVACENILFCLTYLEGMIERREKRNGTDKRIHHKGIEIHLKQCGVRICALDVRFPKHNGESADADEHNDYLKKYG
jgi:hypothetical protein